MKEDMPLQKELKKYYYWLQSLFLNGLFTILPIALTVSIFKFAFNFLKSWLTPIYNLEPAYLQRIQHSEIILAILFLFLLGAVLKFFLLANLIQYIEEKIFNKIPFMRQIYFGIKQLVDALSPANKVSFKGVVIVEFPRPEVYSIGFLTNAVPIQLSAGTEKTYSIFIPTTPNPTTGFYIMVPEKLYKIVDLTHQEAMAIVISGGLIQPERFSQQKNR